MNLLHPGIGTHEILLHKNNSPGPPDKYTPLTGSCIWKIMSVYGRHGIIILMVTSPLVLLHMVVMGDHLCFNFNTCVAHMNLPRKTLRLKLTHIPGVL